MTTRKDLMREVDRLMARLEEVGRENGKLKARVDQLERGGRCSGRWCGHCEHCGPGKMERIGTVFVEASETCLLDVPCSDFKRKGGGDNG